MVNEFGLGAAIIQNRELTRDQISQIGGVAALGGGTFTIVSIALAKPIALFFGEDAVATVVMALSVTFLLGGMRTVPRSLLAREYRFRRLAVIDGLEAASLSTITLILAILGFSYWSLVIGSIAASLVGTCAILIAHPHKIAIPVSFTNIRVSVEFGWNVVATRIAWYAYSNADFMVVGRFLGANALGAYTIGWNLANIPVERISSLVTRVALSIFSGVQQEPASLRRYLLGLTEGIAMIAFPASIGLALVAPEFVLVVLGGKWETAILPLRILAFYAGFRSITTVLPQVLVATGNARKVMHYSLISLTVLPIAFIAGTRWGTAGVAAAWIVAFPWVTVPFVMREALMISQTTGAIYVRCLWPAVSATIVMSAAVLAAKLAFPNGTPIAVILTVQVFVGIAAYTAIVWTWHKERVRAFVRLIKDSRK